MNERILHDSGQVDTHDGYVLIDGKGHPSATYTPQAAADLANKLGEAARKAASPTYPSTRQPR